MRDNLVIQRAREWVDSLETRWRLQVLSEKYRVNRLTGERKKLPVRIRRFVEGIPWALVDEATRYLLSKAPYTGIIYNGVEVQGRYRPTLTTWTRDNQMSVNGPGRPDATYTLVQDLVEMEEDDIYGAASQVSCTEEVVTEWHWDEDSLVDLPPPEQGVTYAVVNVGRKEDGTFDYAVVKRRALTQHTPVSVAKDTVVEHATVEAWDNVYTDADGNYIDDTGAPLDIPVSGAVGGVVTEVSRAENPDCTFKVQATMTEAKEVCVKDMTTETQYERQESVSCLGQKEPLPSAPPAEGGVVVRHENQLQPDGNYSTEKTTTTELPVEHSVVRVTVGRRGKRREVVDRHQAVPAVTEGLKVGQSVTVEKTQGKLYDNTRVDFDVNDETPVGESCKIDLYQHQHSRTIAGVDAIPGVNEHVEGSGQGGFIKTRSTQMDDEGSISQTNEVLKERPVVNARETWSVGLRGVKHRVENQHVGGYLPAPSYSKANFGKVVSNEKTPGGLVNTVLEEFVRSGEVMKTGVKCRQTMFEHEDAESTRDPSGALIGHACAAGNGKYFEVRGDLQDDGSSIVTKGETAELAVAEADVSYRRTANAIITRRTDRNVFGFARMPSNPGESSEHSTNPGGSRNVSNTTVELTGDPGHARCSTTVFLHSHDRVTTDLGGGVDTSCASPAKNGHYFDKQSSADEYGIVTTVERDNEELSCDEYQVEYRKTAKALVTRVTNKNSNVAAKVPDDIGGVESHVMTPGGRYDHTVVVVEANAEPDRAFDSDTIFLHVHDDVEIEAGGELSSKQATSGDGEYQEINGAVDDYGIVTTVVRHNIEKPVLDAQCTESETAFEVTKSKLNRNVTSCVLNSDFSRGSIVVVRHSRNPGGSFDCQTDTRVGKEQSIFLSYESEKKSVEYGWWKNQDRGFSQSEADGLDEVKLNSITASINEFGLEDGSYTSRLVRKTGHHGHGPGEETLSDGWYTGAGGQTVEYYRYTDDMLTDSDGVVKPITWKMKMTFSRWGGLWHDLNRARRALMALTGALAPRISTFVDNEGAIVYHVTGEAGPQASSWERCSGSVPVKKS